MPLAHLEYGSGRPVVILHGLFGSGRNWTAIAKRLGGRHHVFVPDLRNHGDSFWSETMSYDDMADDLGAFFHRHGLAGAALIGHSMGGKAAMHLALSQPRLVGALLVADIAPAAYGHSFAAYVEAMRAVDPARRARRAEVDAELSPAIPDPGVRAFLMQNLVPDGQGYRWRINLDALAAAMAQISDFPPVPHGRAFRGPTLFLAGGRSDYLKPDHHAPIHRLFPAARIEVLAGAGHWLHAEQPGPFTARVMAFLDGTRAESD